MRQDVKSRKYVKTSILPHFSYYIIKGLLCSTKQTLQKSKQKIFLQILSRAVCQEGTASQLEQPKRVPDEFTWSIQSSS